MKKNKMIRVKITQDFASGLPGAMFTGQELSVPEHFALSWIKAGRAMLSDESVTDESFARRLYPREIRPQPRKAVETRAS